MSLMSYVRSYKTASNQSQDTGRQWRKSLWSWGKWSLSHLSRPPQGSLPSGGQNSRSYPWKQTKRVEREAETQLFLLRLHLLPVPVSKEFPSMLQIESYHCWGPLSAFSSPLPIFHLDSFQCWFRWFILYNILHTDDAWHYYSVLYDIYRGRVLSWTYAHTM